MNVKLVAVGLICTGFSLAAQEASAQQQERYMQCRSQAAAQGISGEAYGDFLEKCMSQDASSGSSSDRLASCQREARGTGGRGEAYGKALDLCLMGASSASGGQAPMKATYADCRSRAISQGASSGEPLMTFINVCVGN